MVSFYSGIEIDIFDVIKSGELCEVEKLVEKLGSEILSARDKHGYTPAHWAALDGNVEIMRYLVERNAPVDLPCLGTQGPRPIHWVSVSKVKRKKVTQKGSFL